MKKIKNMPIKIFIKKLLTIIRKKVYLIIRELIVKSKFTSIDENKFMNWKSDMDFFFNSKNKSLYIQKLNNKNKTYEITKQADKICSHTFNLLGSGEINLGENINWNQDFESKFIWENQFYNRIETVNLKNNADIKIPWELSRFQHIPILGQAYWLTNNNKYAEEFKNQIIDWIKKNPVEMSVNWTCAMEVSIRACNWITGYYYFKNSNLSEKFWSKFNKYLYLHGVYIFNNLEKGEANNNHYLFDLAGLVWLGMYFNNFDYKKNNVNQWLTYGLEEFEKEIETQIYEDGCDFESSTSYHGLVSELLLYTLILCESNNIFFSKNYAFKLEKMLEVILNITKPNGLIPIIGDMDSGRFIMFNGYGNTDRRDFRYLLGVAGEYFNRDDFRFRSNENITAFWLLSEIKEKKNENYKLDSVSYLQGGLHILRNNHIYIIIRCGQNGIMGHTHNDQLSFELNVNGEDFIVDPGTHVYTSDYKSRNLFRSTKYHNTIQIGDFEQNNFSKVFRMDNETNAKMLIFKQDYFEGIHYGYNNSLGIIHRREIKLDNDEVKMIDYLTENNYNNIFLNINVAPGIKTFKNESGIVLLSNKNRVRLNFEPFDFIEIEDRWFSKSYGYIEKSKAILVKLNNNSKLKTNIYVEQI